jgi:ketosteroid isomerase-like protein
MQRRILFAGLTTVVLSACFAAENPANGGDIALAAAREQVRQRLNTWQDATRRGDLVAAKDHWTADLRVQEAGFDLAGPAIFDFVTQFFTTHRVTAVEFSATETTAHDGGAVVYQLGHYTETIEPRDGSAAASTVRANFLARWVRGDDGVYRLHRFFGTPMPVDAQVAAAMAQSLNAPVGSIDDRLVRQQIAQRFNEYTATRRANDAGALASFWVDDAAIFEAGVQKIGKASLTHYMGKLLADQRVSEVDAKLEEIFVHDGGSTAYMFGSVVEVLEPRDGKAGAATSRLNVVLRWRRGADGNWRIDRIYGTPLPEAGSTL